MTGVNDGDANEYDSDPNDNNNRSEIEIPHYYYPSEEQNDHRRMVEDDKGEIENNNDNLQESYDYRMSEDDTLSTGPESFNVEIQDEKEYDPNDTTVSSSLSHATPSENTGYNLRANRISDYSHQFGFSSTMFEEELMVKPTQGYALTLRYIQSAVTEFYFYSNFVEEDPKVEWNSELDKIMPEVTHKVMVQYALQKG